MSNQIFIALQNGTYHRYDVKTPKLSKLVESFQIASAVLFFGSCLRLLVGLITLVSVHFPSSSNLFIHIHPSAILSKYMSVETSSISHNFTMVKKTGLSNQGV